MLHLIFGRSGSGKTSFALNKANEAASGGKNVVLIVPEQFTFETERALVQNFGPQSCLNIEALSFSRLVHRVMSLYGGLACRYIDDCGRYILMRLALKQVSGMLKVYSRQAGSASFAKAMVDAVGEYKVCGIDADTLETAAIKSGGGLLRQKLEDISLIMRVYNALLENGFSDPLDYLSRLAQKLDSCRFFEGKTVIFDGFKGFTPHERTVMGKIFCQAEEVYVTLCAESLGDTAASGIFSPVEKTARQMVALAQKCGCPVASPVRLNNQWRFEKNSLFYLEKTIFRPGEPAFEQKAPEIQIISVQNVYDEAKFAACEISRIVRETGCRFGEITIISRRLELYDGILDTAFEQFGIPLFYDFRRGIESHPMMALVLSLMDMMTTNFRQEHVLRYLKTGLAGFSVEEVSQIENYMLMWDIKGIEQWNREWRGSPSGFDGKAQEEYAKELEMLNTLRARFIEPVAQLKEKMGSGGMARELYDFLCKTGVREAVTACCLALKESGEARLSEEYAQIWGKLVSMLDQITIAAKEQILTLHEFAELLRLVIANTDLGSIPPSLDAVVAGDAERIRTGGAKYVFVIGLAEGVFPRSASAAGLVSDTERRKLISLGLELSPPADEQAADERFFAYKAFTCASNGVYLSCPRGDAAGRALRPSYFLSAVKKLFPLCEVRDETFADPLYAVVNKKTAFDLLAQRYGDNSPLSAALSSVFEGNDYYRARLAAFERASGRRRLHFSNAATARDLYGENMRLSPSRIETFEQCRFLYFCRYGLRAKPRKRAELDAPEIGTVIHFVLERLLSQTSEKGLQNVPENEIGFMVSKLLQEFASVYLGGLEDKPERFRHLFATLADTVICLVKHIAEEFAQSGFKPADFELAIMDGGDVEPYEIALPDGGKLKVGGKIDRVDTMRVDGKTYLRVVDYKTGYKTFNLNDLLYGLNLQMFIYLFTICANAKDRYGALKLLPAGVLYVPAKRPEISAPRGMSEAAIKIEVSRELRMNGLVVDEPDVILGMESSGAGRFVPASLKTDVDEDGCVHYAVSGRSSVASLEQFGILKRHIEETLKAMAKSLRAGDAAAVPVSGLSYRPCDYCDYSCVCGFGPGCEVKNITSVDRAEIWDRLKGGDDDGTGMD
jgi:ATP-dependent helicase/nuclease subunit B